MIEHERSYILKHSDARAFLADFPACESFDVTDYYLRRGKRVRHIRNGDPHYFLTNKVGDKAHGFRFEDEKELDPSIAEMLIGDADLVIEKERNVLCVGDPKFQVTIDFVQSPLQLAILEIEASDEAAYPVPVNITSQLFGMDLKECPMCSHSLFRRKIGICGGPSSGKTETAKYFSHRLNVDFGANSFHVAEFATTFIQKYHRAPTFGEQFLLWHGQKEREQNADMADIVISDCPTFLSYIYSIHLDRPTISEQAAFLYSKIYKRALFDILSYTDIIFLQVLEYKSNRVRFQNHDEAIKIESKIRQFLEHHNVPHVASTYKERDQILSDLFYINEL